MSATVDDHARWARRAAWAFTAALALVLTWIAREMQEAGHGWGDDFALYINQARGLVEGTAADVVSDNKYAMDNSAWSTFTPIAYPWGTSILLFPFVLLFGIDYGWLKWVPTLAFVGTVLVYQRLAVRRLPPVVAGLAVLLVALNPWYVTSTDAVLSDLPFMLAVVVAIAAMDRAIDDRSLLVGGSRWAVVAGIAVAVAFHFRREGVGLVVALAVAQLTTLRTAQLTTLRTAQLVGSGTAKLGRSGTAQLGRSGTAQREAIEWRILARPWAWCALVAGVGHVLFTAPILGNVDEADGTGPSQIGANLAWYRLPFAELLGLKSGGDEPVEAFGNEFLGAVLFSAVLAFALVGAVFAIVRLLLGRPTMTAHVVAAVAGVGLLVMMTPYHYQRYLFALAPLVVLVAARGVVDLCGVITDRRFVAAIVGLALLGPLVWGATDRTVHALRFHRTYDYVHWGPEDRRVAELFDAVRRLTDGRDVIVFFQARTMNLYTRRLAIQGNDVQMMLERGDWYAMERDSDYIQTPLTDEAAAELGFEKVWENERFVLWDIPARQVPRLAE